MLMNERYINPTEFMQRNSAEVINAIRQTGNTVAALNSLLVLTTSGVVAVSLLISW